MTVERRIRLSLLLQKMYEQRIYSEKLGLEDISTFHGERIKREDGNLTC